jgi:hypothetical protein
MIMCEGNSINIFAVTGMKDGTSTVKGVGGPWYCAH